MKKVKITLNNEILEVDEGTTILDAARSKDIFIPTFCHSSLLKPESSCYVCVVEVEGEDELIPSCDTSVQEGMVINTSSDRVYQARQKCIELLLSDHIGDCLGPCMTGCPAGIDIPGFIKHIADGENLQALKLIKHNIPFPGILGRICKKPCEDACRRQLVEEPVSICHLKRFVDDEVSKTGDEYIAGRAAETGRRIAIVGAGPAGLSAAYYLQILGHACTVYDENDKPGGMLRYGIPQYRLPEDIIDKEVRVLEKLGIEFEYNKRLGEHLTINELRNEYDALFLGFGAGSVVSLGVKGENAKGVISGLAFLRDHNKSHDLKGLDGQDVAVIGGGDVAIDAARVARRMGAASVSIFCLEKDQEMPASDSEVKAAIDEGIGINCERGVKTVCTEKGKLKGLEFMCCTSVFDEEGDFCPEYDESEITEGDFNTVIVAIGQTPDPSLAKSVGQSNGGLININENTMQTNLKDVFAGGDCVTGPKSVVDAVAAGRRAAISIDQFVMGYEVVGEPVKYNNSMGGLDDLFEEVTEKFDKSPAVKIPELKAGDRVKSFEEVVLPYSSEEAMAEARRCMECGCRDANECRLRAYAACFGVDEPISNAGETRYDLDESHPRIVYAAHKCVKCRTCVRITEEILGTNAMQLVGRGYAISIKPTSGKKMKQLDSKGLEKIVENCPVGALTFKDDPVQTLDPAFKRPEVSC